jgi:glyoxalase superfamily protein
MATRLVHLVIDSADPHRIGQFWADALGWEIAADDPDEVEVMPPGFVYPGPSALPLVFVLVTEPKKTKNRVHLDLASTSPEHFASLVERMLSLGASRLDIGQGDVPWEVMADPDGNEFCVLEPRPEYADTGPIAAIVVDSADREASAQFWLAAGGWPITGSDDFVVSLRSPTQEGPFVEFMNSADPKLVKNRVHLDVAPYHGEDQAPEAERLISAGAAPADVGQGEQSWIVLADPDGQEFCILSPR